MLYLDDPIVDSIFSTVSNHNNPVVDVVVGAALEDSALVWLEAAVHRHRGQHGAVLSHQLLEEGLVPTHSPVTPTNVGTYVETIHIVHCIRYIDII